MEERVQKLMAQAGLGSRRACEALISQGRVRVNGAVVGLGAKADPETDTIEVDSQRLRLDAQPRIYIALYKPRNTLSSTHARSDDSRRTVRDLVPVEGHLFMIGRLDAESEGLIVLTNDGALTNRLTHPRYGHTKTYRVVVHGLPTAETVQRWESGVFLEDEGVTAPCRVRVVKGDRSLTTLEIVMTEGKKRQIRRVAAALGHPVHRLTRTHIGKLGLGNLRPGEWRELSPSDVQAMLTPHVTVRLGRTRATKRSQTPARPTAAKSADYNSAAKRKRLVQRKRTR
ncbi:MAG: pseudouridine synthase [Aggregatilineales bacterium]